MRVENGLIGITKSLRSPWIPAARP